MLGVGCAGNGGPQSESVYIQNVPVTFSYSKASTTCLLWMDGFNKAEEVSANFCTHLVDQEEIKHKEKRTREIVEETLFKWNLSQQRSSRTSGADSPAVLGIYDPATIDPNGTINISPCEFGQFVGCPEQKQNDR